MEYSMDEIKAATKNFHHSLEMFTRGIWGTPK